MSRVFYKVKLRKGRQLSTDFKKKKNAKAAAAHHTGARVVKRMRRAVKHKRGR